jgi:methyltransferase (TIGR00027 family)
MMPEQIQHVSDTALMVAACRALETASEDGLIRDPFAERLAGERGMAIAHSVPLLEMMRFGVAIRARTLDEMLMGAIPGGKIATVVNLGAGLDTRPWRLDLPAALRWIEADYPAMLEYKAGKLAGEKPRCHWEQIPADLASTEDRNNLFARIGHAPALMITEGLLMYLPREAFVAIASKAPRQSGVRHWLLDVASEAVMRMAGGGGHSPVDNLRPKDHLAGQAILDAARACGWRVTAKRTYVSAGAAAPSQRVAKIAGEIKKVKPDFVPLRDELSGMYLLGALAA